MTKLALIAAALAAPLSALAITLVDQSSIDPNGFVSDAYSTNGTQFYSNAQADEFQLGQAATISTIEFWGSSENFLTPNLENFSSFQIMVMDSNFNQIATSTVSTASLSPTLTGAQTIGEGNEYLFTFNTNLSLAAGSYRLHVGSVNANPGADAFIWAAGGNGNATNWFNTFDQTGWNLDSSSGIDMAFRISGNPVPEPASMAVLGLGVLSLVRRRRSRSL